MDLDQGDLDELERQAFEFFGRSEISRDMKKSYKYHLYISKSCIDSQILEGVAQKLGLPCPFQFWDITGRKSVNLGGRFFSFWI